MAGICTPHHVGRDKPHPGLAARHMWRRWIGENALSDWQMGFEGGVEGSREFGWGRGIPGWLRGSLLDLKSLVEGKSLESLGDEILRPVLGEESWEPGGYLEMS